LTDFAQIWYAVSDAKRLICKRKLKFLTKTAELGKHCKLFKKYIINELDIAHERLFSQVI